MSKADKKQRHKAKRQAKRRESRRRESISPLKRLADAPGEIEYWMSDGFETFRQVQMFVFKRAAGLTGIACFLVDRGVVGLKDAWSRMHIEHSEFTNMLKTCEERDIPMKRTTQEAIRRMVAGGVRWAHDNGMRLPKEWVKASQLIGGVGDWASADVSRFAKEFVGHPEDLRQRLISEPFDSYLRRSDISFILSDSEAYLDQETGEYTNTDDSDFDDDDEEAVDTSLPEKEIALLEKKFASVAMPLASGTVDWLSTQSEEPSTELFTAWSSILIAAMMSKAAMPNATKEEVAEFGGELLLDLADRVEGSRLVEYDLGVQQALRHLQTDTLMMQKAMLLHGFVNDDNSLESDDGE